MVFNLTQYLLGRASLIYVRNSEYTPSVILYQDIIRGDTDHQKMIGILQYFCPAYYNALTQKFLSTYFYDLENKELKYNSDRHLLYDKNLTFTENLYQEFEKIITQKMKNEYVFKYIICVCKDKEHAQIVRKICNKYYDKNVNKYQKILKIIFREECIYSSLQKRVNIYMKESNVKTASVFSKQEICKHFTKEMRIPKIILYNDRYCLVFPFSKTNLEIFSEENLRYLYKEYGVELIYEKVKDMNKVVDMFLRFIYKK